MLATELTGRESLIFKDDVKLEEHDNLPADVYRFGPLAGNSYSVTHSLSNWQRGILKRCAHQEHQSDEETKRKFYAFVKKYIRKMPMLPPGLDEQQLLSDWLDNSNYNGERRESLRKANAEYHEGIPLNRVLKCTSFIKREFYDTPKEPRIINSRSDWFKAAVGPYIHALEGLVYDDNFIKHCTPSQVVDRMHKVAEGFDLFYETDYSSFEGSFTREYQTHVELAMFRHCLHNYPEVCKLINSAYSRNHLVFRRKHMCSFDGSRMSGDMWTSLANGFSNKMMVLFMADQAKANVKFLVEGDDGFIASNKELDLTIADKLGFKLKSEVYRHPNQVAFCSLRTCGDTLVPNISGTLKKYGKLIDPQITHGMRIGSKRVYKRIRDIAKSKALSLLATSPGIPILQPLAIQQLSLLQDAHVRQEHFDWWERHFFNMSDAKAKPITLQTRKYVERVFHITVEQQLEIEQGIRSCNSICFDIDI